MVRRTARTAEQQPRILLVESDQAMAKIVERALGNAAVIFADTIHRAIQILEQHPTIEIIVSGYSFHDGTARKLFLHARRRWRKIRRVLYVESAADAGPKWPAGLAHEIATDFEALKRATQ